MLKTASPTTIHPGDFLSTKIKEELKERQKKKKKEKTSLKNTEKKLLYLLKQRRQDSEKNRMNGVPRTVFLVKLNLEWTELAF